MSKIPVGTRHSEQERNGNKTAYMQIYGNLFRMGAHACMCSRNVLVLYNISTIFIYFLIYICI